MKNVTSKQSLLNRVMRRDRLAWVFAASALATILVFVSRASASAALAIPTAVIVLIFALYRPKLFFCVGMIVLLAQRTIALRVNLPVVDYLDEGFVLTCVLAFGAVRLLRRKSFVSIPGQIPIILFIVAGVLSSVVHEVPASLTMQGALLLAKGFALTWAVAQVNWSAKDLNLAARIGACIALILIIGAVANLLAPGPWNSLVLNGKQYNERFGVAPVTSFFQHPGYFGTVMCLSVLASIAHVGVFGRSKTAFLIIAGGLFSSLLTARRKIFVGLLAGVTLLGVSLRWKKIALTTALALPVVVAILWIPVTQVVQFTYAEYFTNPDAVARVRLTADSLHLALQGIPLGVGFGRFGSATARSNYSPIYYELGYPNVWGLGPTEETGKFLTDTFWPAIFGETGLLGSILFALILVLFARMFRKTSRSSNNHERWIGLTGLAWSAQVFIESLAGPIYTAVPTFALYFGLVGVCAALMANADRSTTTIEDSYARR